MRTSLNEIKQIEGYLAGQLPVGEREAIEGRVAREPELRLKIFLQKKVYAILRLHHLFDVKKSIRRYHEELFSESHNEYVKEIRRLFN